MGFNCEPLAVASKQHYLKAILFACMEIHWPNSTDTIKSTCSSRKEIQWMNNNNNNRNQNVPQRAI